MKSGHVEEIKSRLPIDDIIGSYLTLEHAGKYLRARCPFHNEKSASFYVSPDRGTYYCFGCAEKGDIFSFVQKYEGLDFRGALVLLANRAGVELEKFSGATSDAKAVFYECLEEATSFFENNITLHPEALEYLKGRTINTDSIKNFRIGFVSNVWDSLSKHLLAKGQTEKTIIECGLAIKGNNGIYDRFRGRVMFPIEDSSGRVIGFSGRVLPSLDDGKSGKYINSPETIVYHKSDILYGLSKAKTHIRKHDFCIIVEGQFDVVLSHQNGFPNTIAVSGTAFSDDIEKSDGAPTHIGLVSRLSKNVILALDADEAGEKARTRIVKEMIGMGMNVKFIRPTGIQSNAKDPADILSSDGGVAKWKEILKTTQTPVVAMCERILSKESVRDKQIRLVKSEIFPVIASYGSAIDRQEASRAVEKYFSLNMEYVLADVQSLLKEKLLNKEINNTKNESKDVIDSSQHPPTGGGGKNDPSASFYGLYFASLVPDMDANKYREVLQSFIKDKIRDDVFEKNLDNLKDKKDELVMVADIEMGKSDNKERFVKETCLHYEEFVLYGRLDELRGILARESDNSTALRELSDIQKNIDSIRRTSREL